VERRRISPENVTKEIKATTKFLKKVKMNAIIVSASLLLFVLLIGMLRARGKFKRGLVGLVDEEWNLWGRGLMQSGHTVLTGAKETDEPYAQWVNKYWKSVGYDYDGYDTDKAWSGAFVSYILKKAGAEGFEGSASHSSYIRRAVANRKMGRLNENYVAYRHFEKVAEVGDLICYSRAGTETDPYDRTSSYESHCDIVVKKNATNVEVIGGNVSNSVTKKLVSTSNGKVLDLSNKWFAIIKNNQTF